MSYTDLTSEFVFKQLLIWQDMSELAANDAYLKAFLSNYRRPVLQFVGVSTVDVENNSGTANATDIVFPDGEKRSVTEDTSVTNQYRRFDITATAQFTTGTEDSGLRSGISEAANTWYAIYAVKSLINTANFVLAGDTTLPLQANFSALNARYGTNSWLYLGMVRNGDNSGATSDLLSFVQSGNRVIFKNSCAGNAYTGEGIRLATTAGATSVTYTYSAGTGTTDIPNHATIARYSAATAAGVAGTTTTVTDSGAARKYFVDLNTGGTYNALDVAASDGLKVSAGSVAMDIMLQGFIDNVLGVGPNALL